MSSQADRPDKPGAASALEAQSAFIEARPGTFRCDVSRDDHTASVRAVGELDLATVPVL